MLIVYNPKHFRLYSEKVLKTIHNLNKKSVYRRKFLKISCATFTINDYARKKRKKIFKSTSVCDKVNTNIHLGVNGVSGLDLSGNEASAGRLRQAAERGKLAHALLFTGSGNRMAAARFAAAAFVCTAVSGRPCGVCPACRKVEKGIHPDVVEVRDDAHKNVAVDVIRAARTDAYVRPNEGARKVYLFPDCSLLTEQDQNVLLKIVEEGPPYAAFCFCAENPASVLATLRSRCVEVPLRPSEAETAAVSERARALCGALCAKKAGGPTEALMGLERAKVAREDVKALLEETHGVFSAALLALYGGKEAPERDETAVSIAKNLTKTQIVRTIELLQKYRLECRYNVSAGQVLGALAVELEGIL